MKSDLSAGKIHRLLKEAEATYGADQVAEKLEVGPTTFS